MFPKFALIRVTLLAGYLMASVGGELLHFQWHAAKGEIAGEHHCCVFHSRDTSDSEQTGDQNVPPQSPESDQCDFQATLYQPKDAASNVVVDFELDSAEQLYEFSLVEFCSDVASLYQERGPPTFAT